ncbi:restriction endonuclease subunit S [Bradyrhizobium ottawaense]|uniref:restriction endonuclease subunit S n=1 Tax=Bradyrhizobium ottawaense TaxID=931866 RepID=UPI0027F9F82C|nr:restriction endonuclease subunit S [Bradyrhizobium ottawaense]
MSAYPKMSLGDFCETGSGGTPSRANTDYYGGSIPWVKSGELREEVITDTEEKITERAVKESSAKIIPKGAILLAMYGATVGRMAFLGIDAATNQAVCNIRPDPKRADSRYVFHCLQSQMNHFLGRAAGGAQPNISQGIVKETKIPLPSLEEQQRIAAILDKADALRRKRKRARDLVNSLSGELFVEMFGECKPNSQRWPLSTVAEMGNVQLGRQRAPKYQTGKFRKPYLRVANVYEDRIDTDDILSMDFNDRDFRDYKLDYGDILLNEGQSTELVGRPAMWRSEIQDCCFQNTLIRFQSDRSRVLPGFALGLFLQYFRTGEFAKISSKTSNVAHLGAGRFGLMPFPVPPLSLQHEFVKRVAVCMKMKELCRTDASVTNKLFSSLQTRAFSGQL